ncbi:MAG: glycosyltransferase family 39 protein [Patescibacteria group bacterium]
MKKLFRLPYSFSLLAILFFSTLVRLFNLGYPAEYVFDERYHVPAVKLIAEGDPRAFEWWHRPIYGSSNHDWLHPPLAKYIQASFYNLGSGSVESWRMGSVIFGLAGIVLVYVLASLVTNNQLTGLLAALFLSLDGLWLVQSRVAMNDIFLSVFLLVIAIFYWLFLRYRSAKFLLISGLFLGLALAIKWTAIFWLVGLFIFAVIKNFKDKQLRKIPLAFFSLILMPLFIYFVSYLPVLQQGRDFSFLFDLHKNIFYYQTHRDGLHPYQSTPFQWMFNWRSVWYWTNGIGGNIYLLNQPLLAIFYFIALILSVYFMVKKFKETTFAYLILLYALSFSGWVFSPRILFYYHYLPAIPFLAVMLAICFKEFYFDQKNHLYLFLLTTFLLIISFWLYYPLWLGLPVPHDLQQAVYWLLPSWK